MKFGVIVFPGSNCDDDLVYVLKELMGQDVIKIFHKEQDLQGVDFVLVPGGFAYGDYLRAGAIARFSPIMESIQQHAQKGGHVMGICNGFQILCETGLLDGALLKNNNQKYICKNIYLKASSEKALISQNLDKEKAYKIPIAHGEGRYYASPEIIDRLQQNDQVIFRYCSADGQINDESNPNGSLHNIAGISNTQGNVFGLMPHPERAADPQLGNTDGKAFFEAILQSLAL